jgi:hypothetical protein
MVLVDGIDRFGCRGVDVLEQPLARVHASRSESEGNLGLHPAVKYS